MVEEQGADLLDLRTILSAATYAETEMWWSALPVIGRSRGRWVFVEPAGIPGMPAAAPRQRVRRQLPIVATGDAPDVVMTERHNKSSINQVAAGPHLDAWKEVALKTTNQTLMRVPKPPIRNAEEVWLRMMKRSHGSILQPGAMDILDRWQASGATARQKEAFSELMWSMQDHMTAKRGRTETKISFGPKVAIPTQINLIDPFYSTLGRPSSAPIAHAVQMKFEATKRAEEKAQQERADAYSQRQKAEPSKEKIETFKSTIPLKWPGAERYFRFAETSTQAQERTVKPLDRALSLERNPKSLAACQPTSYFMRTVGEKQWHGDARYPEMIATATSAFPFAVDDIPRTQAYHRMKRYVV